MYGPHIALLILTAGMIIVIIVGICFIGYYQVCQVTNRGWRGRILYLEKEIHKLWAELGEQRKHMKEGDGHAKGND